MRYDLTSPFRREKLASFSSKILKKPLMIFDFGMFPKKLTLNTYLINIQCTCSDFCYPEETPFDLKNESKRDMFLGKNP